MPILIIYIILLLLFFYSLIFNLNVDEAMIQEYFMYLMNRYSEKCPAICALVDAEVEIKANTLIIYVNNMAEDDKLRRLEKDIVMDFRSFGYKIERINPILKEEPETVIEMETEVVVSEARLEQKAVPQEPVNNFKKNFKPKPIETDDHPDVVLGRLIDTEKVRLDTIAGPTNGVTLEAELFGLDVRETKTDLIIITLKITDYTDSIYGKLFINGNEEWGRLKKLLKPGKWYKFRGNIKEDKYSNEDVLSILDINYSEYKKPEIIDDAPIKRVELHAHTMMSQMDGITKVDLGKHTCELVTNAINMGYRGVAITDHSGCQAFPIAYGLIKTSQINKQNADKASGYICK